jgi:hypothetical protein
MIKLQLIFFFFFFILCIGTMVWAGFRTPTISWSSKISSPVGLKTQVVQPVAYLRLFTDAVSAADIRSL